MTAPRIAGRLVSPTGKKRIITAAVGLHSVSESGPRFTVDDLRFADDDTKVGIPPGWSVNFEDVNFAEVMGWTDDERPA